MQSKCLVIFFQKNFLHAFQPRTYLCGVNRLNDTCKGYARPTLQTFGGLCILL